MEYSEEEIEAFLHCSTDKEIADRLGVSIRTIQNHKHDEKLKEILAKRRIEYVSKATAKIQISLGNAIDILLSIMNDNTIAPQIRLNAINMLLSVSKPWLNDYDFSYYAPKEASSYDGLDFL